MAKQPVINSLIEKVELILNENSRLKEECGRLTAERDRLKAENRELKQNAGEMERRIGLLELGGGLAGAKDDADKKRARQHVNRLMREIDRCMALMNR